MFPLKNLDPLRGFPFITLLLIVANFAVFFHQITLPAHAAESFILLYGMVPAKLSYALAGTHHVSLSQGLLPLFTCMFLHGGWLHIIGNMWFLWIFGASVEDRLGPVLYLPFYLVCGIGSSLAQALFSWGSHIPSIGASGAISGVLGAFLIFFPRSRILTLVTLLFIWFLARIPAVVFILLWFAIQFVSGLSQLGAPGNADLGGVAWWAHVGGFALGVFLALIARPMARPSYAN